MTTPANKIKEHLEKWREIDEAALEEVDATERDQWRSWARSTLHRRLVGALFEFVEEVSRRKLYPGVGEQMRDDAINTIAECAEMLEGDGNEEDPHPGRTDSCL